MARSKQTVTEATKRTEEGDGHTRRRDENTSGFEGADSAPVGGKLKGAVGMKNESLQKYQPSRLVSSEQAPKEARQSGTKSLGNTSDRDYNLKSKGNFEGKRGSSQTDADSSARRQPDTNVGGVMGNTKNVARDPGNKGHNETLGFGGKTGDALTDARGGSKKIAGRPGPDSAKGVGSAVEGGILGNTRDVKRDPVGRKNVTEGFEGSGTVGNGFV